MLYHLRIAEDT